MYAAVEDCVLDAWDRSLCRRHPRHVSLHFDGIRVGGIDPAVDVKTLCDEAMQAIQEKTQSVLWKSVTFSLGSCADRRLRVQKFPSGTKSLWRKRIAFLLLSFACCQTGWKMSSSCSTRRTTRILLQDGLVPNAIASY